MLVNLGSNEPRRLALTIVPLLMTIIYAYHQSGQSIVWTDRSDQSSPAELKIGSCDCGENMSSTLPLCMGLLVNAHMSKGSKLYVMVGLSGGQGMNRRPILHG